MPVNKTSPGITENLIESLIAIKLVYIGVPSTLKVNVVTRVITQGYMHGCHNLVARLWQPCDFCMGSYHNNNIIIIEHRECQMVPGHLPLEHTHAQTNV